MFKVINQAAYVKEKKRKVKGTVFFLSDIQNVDRLNLHLIA